MYFNFNVEKLNTMLKDFYEVTKIRIAVLDIHFREVTGYPKSRAAICDFIRRNKKADRDCFECDRRACAAAAVSAEPYVYRCHIGLTEIISPLFIGKTVVGYLFFAHMLSFSGRDEADAVAEYCQKYGFEKDVIGSLVGEMPLFEKDFIDSSAQLLQAVATYLCMEQAALLKNEDLSLRLNRYLADNLNKPLTIDKICADLNVGKTYLCELSQKLYNTGLAEHIKIMRIQKAAGILSASPTVSVSEVAVLCGFNDANYFISAFKKQTGVTPKKFALQAEKQKAGKR